jgi:DNA-binding FadR family transcriptional regulator
VRTREPADPAVVSVLSEVSERGSRFDELKSDWVVAELERRILSGRLAAGARLPSEDELCELLRVSRTVVRDAVRTLVARGLLTVRQGRGTSVATPTDAAYSNALLVLLARSGLSMAAVVEARATIETQLAGLAALTCTDDELAALEDALERFAVAVDADDTALATEQHTRFHTTILGAVHQPALKLMLKPMTEIILVSSTASLLRHSREDWEVDSHRPVLAALKAHDPEAAVAAMTAHFEVSTSSAYQEFLAREFADAYFEHAPTHRTPANS